MKGTTNVSALRNGNENPTRKFRTVEDIHRVVGRHFTGLRGWGSKMTKHSGLVFNIKCHAPPRINHVNVSIRWCNATFDPKTAGGGCIYFVK